MLLDFDEFRKVYDFKDAPRFRCDMDNAYIMSALKITGRSAGTRYMVRVPKPKQENVIPMARDILEPTFRKRFMGQLSTILEDWMSLALAQVSNSIKLEALSLDFQKTPLPDGKEGLTIRPYVCYEKTEFMLPLRAPTEYKPDLSGSRFLKMTNGFLDILTFFEKQTIYHCDVSNPNNLLGTEDGGVRLNPFTLKTEIDFNRGGNSRKYYYHPNYESGSALWNKDHTYFVKNVRFILGMSLLHYMTRCNVSDLRMVQLGYRDKSNENDRSQSQFQLKILGGQISDNYHKGFVKIIEGLLEGKMKTEELKDIVKDLKIRNPQEEIEILKWFDDLTKAGLPWLELSVIERLTQQAEARRSSCLFL